MNKASLVSGLIELWQSSASFCGTSRPLSTDWTRLGSSVCRIRLWYQFLSKWGEWVLFSALGSAADLINFGSETYFILLSSSPSSVLLLRLYFIVAFSLPLSLHYFHVVLFLSLQTPSSAFMLLYSFPFILLSFILWTEKNQLISSCFFLLLTL